MIAVERPLVTIIGLAPNRDYSLSITAVNQMGESTASIIGASTLVGLPESPRNLTLTSGGTTEVELRWEPPSDTGGGAILGYRIWWGTDEVIVTAQHLRVTALTPATRYRFHVTAINEAGESPVVPITGTTLIDPLPRPRPEPPSTVSVTAVTANTILLTWEGPTDPQGPPVTGYRVSDGAGREYIIAAPPLVLRELVPNTNYSVSVWTQSGVGESQPVTVAAKTADVKPQPPAPKPSPAPAPAPQPFTPTPPPGTPELDLDGDPLTVRQTAPGQWPKKRIDRSGRPLVIEKFSGFRTNAGQTVKLSVTKKSPSIKSVKLTRNNKKRVWVMTATLKPGTSSGSVILTVSAPATQTQGMSYEPLQSSQQFMVRR